MDDENGDTATLPTIPGSLSIDDRVVEKLAARLALDVEGVVPHNGAGLRKIVSGLRPGHTAGAALPRARTVDDAGGAAISLEVALTWPSAVTAVCQQVRGRVATELHRLTGVAPRRVDVEVVQLVSAAEARSGGRRAGFVDVEPGDDDASESAAERTWITKEVR